jgi:D-alanyl-D-alanine carboxypeptidase
MERIGSMHRTPPGEDEQDEQSEYLSDYPQDMNQPRKQRRTSAESTQKLPEYDEETNTYRPITLRASRSLSRHDLEASEPTEKGRERPAERQPGNSSTAKHPTTSQKVPYHAPRREDTKYDNDMSDEHLRTLHPARPAHSLRPQSGTTQKILVIPPRRAPVNAPPPLAHPHPSQRQRLQQPLLTRFLEWEHHQAVIVVLILTIAVIILVPILANTVFFAAHPTSSIINSGDTHTTQTGISSNPVDPHELVIIPSDTDHPAPPVFATSAYLLDADTGVTLYAHNSFMHLPMMSTTKLMTAALAVQQGNLDQSITITPAIEHDIQQLSADSSLFGMKQGETYSLRDLLYGLLLVSGNDAAVAIADGLAGSVPHFVAEMNQKAKQLGLYDTHYANPHGLLDPEQYSSAHDLAFLGRYSLNISLIHQITGTQEYHIPKTSKHAEHFLFNDNQFLWWYPGVDGGKPGYDGASNFVQVISVTRNHHHLIGVTMHTNDWWTDMRDLMNWGFDSFNWVSPYLVDLQHPIPYDTLWNFFVKDKKENTIPTGNGGRYYIYTGYSISGPIMTYFDKSGGLKKLGFPIALPKVPDGQTISQQFEHGTIQCNISTTVCQTV